MKITNLQALRGAIADLQAGGIKCSLVEGGTPRAFYPNQEGLGPADFVLKLDASRYDVAFYKQSDGSYEARTDFWGNDVVKVLGAKASDAKHEDQAKLGKLFQAYSVNVVQQQARMKGLMVRKVMGANGSIKLELSGASL